MKNYYVYILLICLALAFPCEICAASPNKKQAKPNESAEMNIWNFEYTSKGRRDPFEPVYRQDSNYGTGKYKTNVLKRGYELEELRLVGILKSGKQRYAMMEDISGKGIIFKKGQYINDNLWIADILDTKVILNYRIKKEVKQIEIDIPKKTEG